MSASTPGPADPAATGRRPGGVAAVLLALFGPLVIWTVAVLGASAASPTSLPDGQCEGIGFGCSLAPADAVLFGGAYLGLFVVPIATVVALVIASVSRRPLPVVGSALAVFASVLALVALPLMASSSGA